jgi:ribosomal protein S6
MSKEQQIDHTEQETESNVYEIGFHFVPTIAEDDVAVQFSHLKSMIEKRGGSFISEDFPKMIPLAYEISKTVKAQKKRYTNAYFGWVKFDLAADKVGELEKEVKAFEPVLRYLVISTVRENTLVVPKERDGKEKKEDGEVDVVQLDKKIEELAA